MESCLVWALTMTTARTVEMAGRVGNRLYGEGNKGISISKDMFECEEDKVEKESAVVKVGYRWHRDGERVPEKGGMKQIRKQVTPPARSY